MIVTCLLLPARQKTRMIKATRSGQQEQERRRPSENNECLKEYTYYLLVVVRLFMLDEVKSLLLRNHIHMAHPVFVRHAIYLICDFNELRPERGSDELCIGHVS